MDYAQLAEKYRSESREINRTKEAEHAASYSVYATATNAADEVRRVARAEAQNAYDKVTAEAANVRLAAEKATEDKAAAALEKLAAEILGQDGGDNAKLFAWMVSGSTWYRRFPEHCTTILDAMPLTIDGLKELSRNHGWCSDFDAFLREALAADAIPGIPTAEAVKYTLDSVMNSAGLGVRSQEQINALVNRLIKQIPADDVKDEDTAPASEEQVSEDA